MTKSQQSEVGDETHYYCFISKAGEKIPYYERTVGSEQAAEDWISENNTEGEERFYSTSGHVPKDFWY